jgi:hypothetical protein
VDAIGDVQLASRAWPGIGVLALCVSACAAPGQPRPRAKVEVVFDTPREYRVLGTLPCAEGAGLVYVLSHEGDLYSFHPDALVFEPVGHLSCQARHGATPNSMAVDRAGTAWLNFNDGSFFRASTRDASCEPTSIPIAQHGFGIVGMAYASTGRDLVDETLFVWGGHSWGDTRDDGWGGPFGPRGSRREPGLGLAAIDTARGLLRPIGEDRRGLGMVRGELTGTGDGKLYGFFATRPATLAEIDVVTGETRSHRPLPDVDTGRAWAFSSWGGDFWFYTAGGGETTSVTRLSGTSGELGVMLTDIGFVVVGAGVSTCAPTGPAGAAVRGSP